MARELQKDALGSALTEEQAMRTQHLLLLSTIALSSQALAAEPKPTTPANGKPGMEGISKTDAARTAGVSEELQMLPARKNRVRQTFPPSAKRM
jgi:hypothetical protein